MTSANVARLRIHFQPLVCHNSDWLLDVFRSAWGGVGHANPVCDMSGLRMTTNRIAAGVLSILLLALLGWSVIAGVGGVRTWVVLGVGSALGLLYTVFGRLPNWIVNHSGGSITEDDDPSNISPRVYLPILLGVIAVAATAFVIVVSGGPDSLHDWGSF